MSEIKRMILTFSLFFFIFYALFLLKNKDIRQFKNLLEKGCEIELASSKKTTIAKTHKLNTRWLQNAAKSIGVTAAGQFQEYAPNISAAVGGISKTGTDIVKNLKAGKGSVNRIQNALSSNKYVQYGKKAYANAIRDLKSGKFNNKDAESEYIDEAFGFGDLSDDFGSFGDFDIDDGSSTEVNVVNVKDDKSSAMLREEIRQSTQATLEAGKASLDASVALTGSVIQQMVQMADENKTHLANIETQLAATNEFLNGSLLKFMESSTAYMEKMGGSLDDNYSYDSKQGTNGSDVFGPDGSINMNAYKESLKKGFQSILGPASFVSGMITDDMLDMIVANPLGWASSLIAGTVVPKSIEAGIKGVEKAFSNFVPALLDKVASWGNEQGAPLIKRLVGKVFGVKSTREDLTETEGITNDPVSFDGVTRATITRIIPKELREQTAYLKAIANHLKIDTKAARNNAEVFDMRSGRWSTTGEITKGITRDYENTVTGAFKATDFGKAFTDIADKLPYGSAEKKSYDKLLNNFFMELERQGGFIDWKDKDDKILKSIMSAMEGSHSKRDMSLLQKSIDELIQNNLVTLMGSSNAIHQARGAANGFKRDLRTNETFNNLIESNFLRSDKNGDKIGFDESIYENLGYSKGFLNQKKAERDKKHAETHPVKRKLTPEEKKAARKTKRRAYTDDEFSELIGREKSEDPKKKDEEKGLLNDALERYKGFRKGVQSKYAGEGGALASFAKNTSESIQTFFTNILYGKDTNVAESISSIVQQTASNAFNALKENFFTPFKNALFGVKGDDGYSEGGVFSDVRNKFKDIFNNVKYHITGHEYTDSNGVKHEEKDDSVFGSFKKMAVSVKDAFMDKFFGKKGDNGEREKDGLFSYVTSAFKEGIQGWKDAIFGTEDPEAEKKKMMDQIQEKMPNALTGAAIGGGLGLMGIGFLNPMLGASLGLVGGILSKSESFQKYLFGEVDENGNQIDGLISKKVQDYVKERKNPIIAGAITGGITGGLGIGLLGNLAGGPVVGALLGTATSLAAKSETFQKFLYGKDMDKNSGEGFIGAVKGIFSSGSDDEKERTSNAKLLGMSAIGAGTGAIAGTIASYGLFGAALGPLGPIGGALIGLGATMKASGGRFKEWLFGKEETDENGKTTKKKGIIGQFGSMLHVSIINPLKHKLEESAELISADFKYAMNTLGNAFLPVIQGIKDKATEIKDTIVGGLKKFANTAKDIFVNPIVDLVQEHIITPVKTIISGVTNILFKGARAVVTAPFKLIGAVTKVIASPFVKAGNKLRKALGKGIKKVLGKVLGTIGGIMKFGLKVVTSPLKLAAKGVSAISGIKDARDANKADRQGPLDKIKNIWDPSIGTRDRQKMIDKQYRTDKKNAKSHRKENKIHDKNALAIAKATNWQLTEDTAENRRIAMAAGAKLNTGILATDELTEEQEEDKKKHRASIVSGQANTEDLDSAEEQQVSLLAQILNVITGHTPDGKKMRKGFFNSSSDTDDGSGTDDDTDDSSGKSEFSGDSRLKDKFNEFREQGMSPKEALDAARNALNEEDEEKKNSNPYEEGSVRWHAWNASHQTTDEINEAGTRIINKLFGALGVDSEDRSLGGMLSNLFGMGSEDGEDGDGSKSPFGKIGSFFSKLTDWGGNAYAKGTDSAEDETALVGEEGPELRALNKGDTIVPTNKPIAVYITGAKQGVFNAFKDIAGKFKRKQQPEEEDLSGLSRQEMYNHLFDAIDDDTEEESDDATIVKSSESEDNDAGEQDVGDITSIARLAGDGSDSMINGLINSQGSEEEVEKREDIAAAIAWDKAQQEKQDKAFENAKTAAELQKEQEEEKEKKERIEREKDNHANLAAQVKETKKNGLEWLKIFGKKGLITAAAVAAFLWAKKNLPGVIEGLASFLKNIGKSAMETVGNIISDTVFGVNNNTDNQTPGEKLTDEVEGVASLNPWKMINGTDGEADHQTYARTKLAAYGANAGVKVANMVRHPVTSAKSAGKNIVKTKSVKKGIKQTYKESRGITDYLGDKVKNSTTGLSEKFQNISNKANKRRATNLNKQTISPNINTGSGETTLATIEKNTGVTNQFDDILTHQSRGADIMEAFGGTADDFADNGIKIVKNNADDIADSGVKLLTNGADDIAEAGASLVKNNADDIAEVGAKAVKGMTSVVDDVGETVVKNKSGILETCKKAISSFLDTLSGKAAKEANTTVSSGIFKTLQTKIDDVLTKYIGQITGKISAILGSEAAAAAAAGIGWLVKNGAGITIGAVDGLTGTARLFRVNKDDVDGTMKIISTIIGGFKGTGVGSIVDVVNELVSSVIGIDIISEAACLVYKVIVRAFGNEEKALKLDEYRDEFQDEYTEYKQTEILKQKETMEKAGLIDSNMSDEDFLTKVDNGEISVNVDSFSEYNDKQNAGIISKATTATMSGLGKVGKAIKGFYVGNKETTYTDANGNTYTDNGDGSYKVTDSEGNDLGTVSKDAVDTSSMEEHTEKKGLNLWGKEFAVAKTVGTAAVNVVKKDYETKKKIVVGIKRFLVGGTKKQFHCTDGSYYESKDGTTYTLFSASGQELQKDALTSEELEEAIASGEINVTDPDGTEVQDGAAILAPALQAYKESWVNTWNNTKEFFSKAGTWLSETGEKMAELGSQMMTKDFWVTQDGTGYRDPTDLSYYIPIGGDGQGFKHYSANDELIEEITDSERVKDINSKVKAGIFEPYEYHIEAGRTKLWNDIKDNFSNAMTSLKEKASERWNNTIQWLTDTKDSMVTSFKNFFTVQNKKGYVDQVDFSYYITEDDGQTYKHYSASGDLIDEVTDAEQVEQIKQMIESGIYVEGQVEPKAGITQLPTQVWNKTKEVFSNSAEKAKEVFDKVGKSAMEGFNKTIGTLMGKISGKKTVADLAFYPSGGAGDYYLPNGDPDDPSCTYDKYNSFGDKLIEGITSEEFSHIEQAGGTWQAAENYNYNAGAKIREIGDKIKGVFSDGIEKAKEVYDTAKEKISIVWENIKENGIIGLIGKFKRTQTGKYGWHDPEGNYYYRSGSSGSWTYYNIHGDVLEENVSDDDVRDKASAGLLTWQEITEDSEAKKALDKIGESVKGAWTKAKDVVSAGWESFKNWLSGGSGGGSGYPVKADVNGSFGNYTFPPSNLSSSSSTVGGNGAGLVKGGSGEGIPSSINGFPYRSQNDPSIKDKPYKMSPDDKATYGTTGCYPAAMGSVVEKLTGRKVSTQELGQFAQKTGSRDASGTNYSYLTDAATAYGVNSVGQFRPSVDYIRENASPDNPMILSGVDDGSMGSYSPFTTAGHAITVVGVTPDGKLRVNNPMGPETSGIFDADAVARQTEYGVVYSKGGRGLLGSLVKAVAKKAVKKGKEKLLSKVESLVDDGSSGGFGRSRRRGGFGRRIRGGRGGDATKWVATVKAVKKAIADLNKGYSQTGFDDITINGVTHEIRRDCSGFVCACLQFYGYDLSDHCLYTGNMMDNTSPLSNTDFTMRNWDGWDSLVEGDIIVNSSHTEIFCRNDGGTHYVYNCGSTTSVNNPDATTSGHSSYTKVWSLGAAPSGSTDISTSDPSSSGVSGNSGTQSIISTLTSFYSEVANRASNGLVSGNFNGDYTDYINGTQSSSSTSTSSTSGTGSDYPKYSLTQEQKETAATVITGETGGTDKVAAYQEASQMVNLNEVSKGLEPTGENLEKTLRSGWYAKASFTRGKTDTAMQAVEDVIVGGKRTLPRYVVEHDTFPMDIKSAKSREEYQRGDDVSNVYGSNYKFYTFFGDGQKGDIAGYFQDGYDKYKDDQPYSVGGSGYGVRGLDMSGGVPSYQQNSSDLGNIPYDNGDGATLADTGCGPSALATLYSNVSGKPASVTGIAADAQRYGMRDETGTNANFISLEASRLGIDTLREDNPSSRSIRDSLRSGHPVMTLGQDNNNIYTDSGHYLNALGIDKNNNVLYADSMKPGLHKTPLSRFTRSTDVAWHSGSLREGGRGLIYIRGNKRGGRGRTFHEPEYIHDFPFYQQHDERWGSEVYGNYSGATTIAAAGCGPSASAMVACSYGDKYDPPMVCDWMVDNGYRKSNNGTSQEGIIAFFKSLGYEAGALSGFDQCLEKLKQGIPVIACMGPGHFTSAGHYIVLSGIDSNGKILISDSSRNASLSIPDGRDRSNTPWDQSVIRSELSHATYVSKNGKGSIGNVSQLSGDTDSSSSTSASVSSNTSTFISQLTSLGSEIATRAMNGLITGEFDTNYDDFLNGTSTDASINSSSSSSSGTMTGNTTGEKVFSWLVSKGYSKEAAAGIIGNMQQESGVDPEKLQSPTPHAAGICQWESYKRQDGRWKQMSDYANAKGKEWTDLESQLEFMDLELQGTNGVEGTTAAQLKKKAGGYEAFKKLTDINTATKAFEESFERAGTPMMENRYQYAADAYNTYAKGGSGHRKTDATLRSIQRRYPVTQRGGRGYAATPLTNQPYSTKDLTDIQNVLSQSQRMYQSRSKGSSTNSSDEFFYQVIQILGVIANNTGQTVNQLQNMPTQTVSVEGGNTVQPVVIGGGNQTPTELQNLMNSNNESRNQRLASLIARGE